MLWTIAIVDATGAAGRGRLSGQPLGTDFVAFYTYAHIARDANYTLLKSEEGFFKEQVRLVPASADTFHPPMYPAQVALFLQPLARMNYVAAYSSWTAWTLLTYGLAIGLMSGTYASLRPWRWHIAAAAVANPTLWLLVLHGQLSVLALAAMLLMWLALKAERPLVAGLGLGLLAYKPPLFAPALALCLLVGEWRVASGAALGATAQYAAAVPWVGFSGVWEYAALLYELGRAPDRVAAKLPLMHSLRTFWVHLLPAALATTAYVLSALVVLFAAARAWRRVRTPLERIAILGMAIVLASPHLYVYDLVLLAPLFLASADIALLNPEARGLRLLTYAAFSAPFWGIPLAAAGFQASTLVYAAWFVAFSSHAGGSLFPREQS